MADVVPVGANPDDGTGIDYRAAFIAINYAFGVISDQLSRVASGNSSYALKSDITAAINGLQAAFDAKADLSALDGDVANINAQLTSFLASLNNLSAQVQALIANPPSGGSATETLTQINGGTSYTVKATDTFVEIKNLAASFSATLPPASSYKVNRRLVIYDGSGLATPANQISAIAGAGDTIEGLPSLSTGQPYGKLILVSNGANLWLAQS
jgi:hypothetical protein